MKSFEYHATDTVEEACSLLAQYGDDAKIISGGQSLIALMKEGIVSPGYLIDIKGLSDLDYIRYDDADGLRIGGLTTHRALEKSDIAYKKYPILRETERTLASVPIRNWGTLGGSLAHADPASDMAATLRALGAEVTLTGLEDTRVVSLDDFFLGHFETALAPSEILTEIHIPGPRQLGAVFSKFALRPTDMAVVNIAVHLIPEPDDSETCQDIRVVLGAVGPACWRAQGAEDLIRGNRIDDALIDEAARLTSAEANPADDINGSEEFKRDIIQVLVRRSIKAALARALSQ